MLENGWAILGRVFVSRNAGLGTAKPSRGGVFAVEKRVIAQILAVVLD